MIWLKTLKMKKKKMISFCFKEMDLFANCEKYIADYESLQRERDPDFISFYMQWEQMMTYTIGSASLLIEVGPDHDKKKAFTKAAALVLYYVMRQKLKILRLCS